MFRDGINNSNVQNTSDGSEYWVSVEWNVGNFLTQISSYFTYEWVKTVLFKQYFSKYFWTAFEKSISMFLELIAKIWIFMGLKVMLDQNWSGLLKSIIELIGWTLFLNWIV